MSDFNLKEGHTPVVHRFPEKILVKCSCGETWSHKPSETNDMLNQIYLSHVAYFNRPKTTIL